MLNVAVIGMGWWGKTLVTAIKRSSKLKVVKAMKRSPQSEALPCICAWRSTRIS